MLTISIRALARWTLTKAVSLGRKRLLTISCLGEQRNSWNSLPWKAYTCYTLQEFSKIHCGVHQSLRPDQDESGADPQSISLPEIMLSVFLLNVSIRFSSPFEICMAQHSKL